MASIIIEVIYCKNAYVCSNLTANGIEGHREYCWAYCNKTAGISSMARVYINCNCKSTNGPFVYQISEFKRNKDEE